MRQRIAHVLGAMIAAALVLLVVALVMLAAFGPAGPV